MNAITLEILLHYYFSGEKYKWLNSKTESMAVTTLLRNDLLQSGSEIGLDYSITPRGRVHIEALLNAPLPKPSWISPIPAAEKTG